MNNEVASPCLKYNSDQGWAIIRILSIILIFSYNVFVWESRCFVKMRHLGSRNIATDAVAMYITLDMVSVYGGGCRQAFSDAFLMNLSLHFIIPMWETFNEEQDVRFVLSKYKIQCFLTL